MYNTVTRNSEIVIVFTVCFSNTDKDNKKGVLKYTIFTTV